MSWTEIQGRANSALIDAYEIFMTGIEVWRMVSGLRILAIGALTAAGVLAGFGVGHLTAQELGSQDSGVTFEAHGDPTVWSPWVHVKDSGVFGNLGDFMNWVVENFPGALKNYFWNFPAGEGQFQIPDPHGCLGLINSTQPDKLVVVANADASAADVSAWKFVPGQVDVWIPGLCFERRPEIEPTQIATTVGETPTSTPEVVMTATAEPTPEPAKPSEEYALISAGVLTAVEVIRRFLGFRAWYCCSWGTCCFISLAPTGKKEGGNKGYWIGAGCGLVGWRKSC